MLEKINDRTPIFLLFLYEIFALGLLFIYSMDKIDKYTIYTGIGLVFLVFISNFFLLKITKGDKYIFLIANMLMSIGIIVIYRLNSISGARQLNWLIMGIFIFFISYFAMKYLKIRDNLIYVYIGAIYILFLLTFVFGTRTHGAINWIRIGPISIQAAEISKILLVFVLASYYSNVEKYKRIKNSSLYLLLIVYSFIALLFLQRDLGMALIFYGVYLALQFIYEKNQKLILLNIALFSLGGVFAYFMFSHVRVRFITWLNPFAYIDTMGYQITQSLMAIAEGGFFGSGLGLGHPYFIPLAYNDFIFAAICEELGIFTGIGIILLFMILVYRGFKISINQKNSFFKNYRRSIKGNTSYRSYFAFCSIWGKFDFNEFCIFRYFTNFI